MFIFALQPKKENRNPLSNTQLQPSCVPPVRNPFKAVGQKEKDHERKKSQTAEGGEKREEQDSKSDPQEAGGRESRQKENVRKEASEVEKESKSTMMSSDTYRGKQLPAGMKVKKRLSDEESPKENDARNGTEKVKAKSRESNSRTEEDKSIPTSSIEPVRPEKTSPAVQDPPKGKKHPNKDSKSTEDQTSECQKQSTEIGRARDQQEDDDDDDDDVVLVSVKPAAAKSSPVSAVQKTLTAFPGFQPASSVKSQQEDPRGLRNLLTTQLKQKKVSVVVFLFFFAFTCSKQMSFLRVTCKIHPQIYIFHPGV